MPSLNALPSPLVSPQLLTWEVPFEKEGKNAFQLVFMVASGSRLQLPPLEAVAGAAPDPAAYAAFTSLIRRCWAQEPAERPAFEEIIQELRGAMARTVSSNSLQPSGSLQPTGSLSPGSISLVPQRAASVRTRASPPRTTSSPSPPRTGSP